MVTPGGWELADYEWDPETGLARFTYERRCPDTLELQEAVIVKRQPALPKHEGWRSS